MAVPPQNMHNKLEWSCSSEADARSPRRALGLRAEGNGALQGIITDGDLRRHMSPELMTRLTGQVMTTGSTSIRPEALVNEALRTMNTKFITTLFVVQNERPVGIIHIHDCLRAGVA